MTEHRVRVSAELYRHALADAIDWVDSILASHDPESCSVTSCCKPGARCEQYQIEAAWLRRYRRAYGPQKPQPGAKTVTLAEIVAQASADQMAAPVAAGEEDR
jgi:hypothetical protein